MKKENRVVEPYNRPELLIGRLGSLTTPRRKKLARGASEAAREVKKALWLKAYEEGSVELVYRGRSGVTEGLRAYNALLNFRGDLRKRPKPATADLLDKLQQVQLSKEMIGKDTFRIVMQRVEIVVSPYTKSILNLLDNESLGLLERIEKARAEENPVMKFAITKKPA